MCDGAEKLDGAGYNKLDARLGHAFAERESLSPKMLAVGWKLVNKYRRQLPEIVLSAAGIKVKGDQ